MKISKIPSCVLAGLIACECGECRVQALGLVEVVLTVGAVGSIGVLSFGMWRCAQVVKPNPFGYAYDMPDVLTNSPYQGGITVGRGSGCGSFLRVYPNGLPEGMHVNTNQNPAAVWGRTPAKPGVYSAGFTLADGCGNSSNIVVLFRALAGGQFAPAPRIQQPAQPLANPGLVLPTVWMFTNSIGTVTTNSSGLLVTTQTITVQAGPLGTMTNCFQITAEMVEDGTGIVTITDMAGGYMASEAYSNDAPDLLQSGFDFGEPDSLFVGAATQ